MWEMVSTTKEDGVLVIAMAGKWMGGDELQQILDLVRAEFMSGGNKIVLDLEMVQWMNSTGIGALAAILTSSKTAQAKLALANVPGCVKELLEVSSLLPLFTLTGSRKEAIALVK